MHRWDWWDWSDVFWLIGLALITVGGWMSWGWPSLILTGTLLFGLGVLVSSGVLVRRGK